MNRGDSIVRARDPERYTPKLRFLLDTLTFNEMPKVVGSYSYLNHKYPSDIDVFEKVVVNLNLEEALTYYENRFKLIVKSLLVEHPIVLITDFKLGEDKRFYETPDKMKGLLRQFLKDIPTEDVIKKYVPLRWKPEEILQGYKKLFDGVKITLREAISQRSIIKLDVITWLEDRFRSVEIFYNLGYVTPDGSDISFYPLGDYSQSLLEDIKKYSSPKYYSPLRVIKRLWNLSKMQDCTELLKIIDPFLSSDAAALNQIKSDIEGSMLILSSSPPYFNKDSILTVSSNMYNAYGKLAYINIISRLTVEMLNFSKRISNHMKYEKYKEFSTIFDLIFKAWSLYKATDVYEVNLLLSLLKKLSDDLSEEINIQAKDYLRYIENLGNVCKTITIS